MAVPAEDNEEESQLPAGYEGDNEESQLPRPEDEEESQLPEAPAPQSADDDEQTQVAQQVTDKSVPEKPANTIARPDEVMSIIHEQVQALTEFYAGQGPQRLIDTLQCKIVEQRQAIDSHGKDLGRLQLRAYQAEHQATQLHIRIKEQLIVIETQKAELAAHVAAQAQCESDLKRQTEVAVEAQNEVQKLRRRLEQDKVKYEADLDVVKQDNHDYRQSLKSARNEARLLGETLRAERRKLNDAVAVIDDIKDRLASA